MKLLVIGHSLVLSSNRKFWSTFAATTGSTVDLVCPKDWSSNLASQIAYAFAPEVDVKLRKVFPLPVFKQGNGSFFFFHPLEFLGVLGREKYDAIYLNQETWALATLSLIVLKLFTLNRRTPIFLCVAQNIKKEKLKFLHPYERLVSRFIKTFLYCSGEVEDVLRWKGIRTPCLYLPLSYDEESYHSGEFSLGPTQVRLGFLGRLSEEKGLRLLLEVLDELNRYEIIYPLIVGGSGPLLPELAARNYVTYLGLIPHERAQEFYRQIDCFILPSQTRPHWKEQFGRVIVEAFAAGRPVIGSSSGSIPEVLRKLQWPWVFEENSKTELEARVSDIKIYLKSSEGREQLRRSVDLNRKLFSHREVSLSLKVQLQKMI